MIARKRRLAVLVSSDMTLKAFLLGHLACLAGRCELSVMADCEDFSFLPLTNIVARTYRVGIVRPVNPWRDARALISLWRLFRRAPQDAIFSVTPKAGLLSMLAGRLAGVPVRVHIFTGQVWATRDGLARVVLKNLDRVTARCATHVLADSESQRRFLIDEGVIRESASRVLAKGSISGVDVQRFRPDAVVRQAVRAELGVPEQACLLLFLGRLNRDKGVIDLAEAFARLAACTDAHLVFVGPDEAGLRGALETACAACRERVHFVDYTNAPQRYMAAADVFCLPSYREGFGSVVIEAAACGLPAVASRIYGLTDAVVDNETGLLHAPGDVAGIANALQRLIDDASLRGGLGDAARRRATTDFSAAQVSQAFCDYLVACMDERT